MGYIWEVEARQLPMSLASHFVTVEQDEPCSLEEESAGRCPLCVYQDDNIIQNINKVEVSLSGRIEPQQIYHILCDMYQKHVAPLLRQGKRLMVLTPSICEEHYTRHVVDTTQQVADDILYCSKMQRHYQKNIALRNEDNDGSVVLNPQNVNEYVKISKHKLDLVKYYNAQKKKSAQDEKASMSMTPYTFN